MGLGGLQRETEAHIFNCKECQVSQYTSSAEISFVHRYLRQKNAESTDTELKTNITASAGPT